MSSLFCSLEIENQFENISLGQMITVIFYFFASKLTFSEHQDLSIILYRTFIYKPILIKLSVNAYIIKIIIMNKLSQFARKDL